MDYTDELSAIQAWIKTCSGLISWRRTEVKPNLARPVITFDTPYRSRKMHLSRWAYEQKVIYYGKLSVANLDQALEYQEKLTSDLEDRCGVIPVNHDGVQVGVLKDCIIEFDYVAGLDVVFRLTVYPAYKRKRPAEDSAPSTGEVHLKLTVRAFTD